MPDWYIKVDGQGSATGHVAASDVKNPLTEATGDKCWYKPATMTKPTPGDGERLTGPVYDVDAGAITYSTETIPVTVEMVRAEAERRIAAGTTINGVQFKCDDQSTNRLHGMWQESVLIEAGGGSYSATFSTEVGDTVTVTSAAEAEALFKAAVAFVRLILGKSAALQAMADDPDGIPTDYTNDSYWTA